ncbi:AAA family ATPase [Ruminococcaceae bacterium OttesenSCG-928-L11]|nr:AAA family ATPase [Ruminococcaceae bacterium OttesenSCG-928-L11]
MAKVLSVTNQKGGVGKTTTSLAIATGLQEKGYKVLAIDMDPQANFTFSLGGEGDDGPTVYELLRGDVKARFAIQRTSYVDLISSNIVLSGAELEFAEEGREYILKKALEPLKDRYDYIVIDSPPALGFLTINALAASDYMVIPMLADIFSLQGVAQLGDSLLRLRQYCNPRLEVGGILLCRYDGRTVLGKRIFETAEMVAEQIGTRLYKSKIRHSVSIQEAQTNQVSMFEYAPRNPGVRDYMAFVEELLAAGV